MSSLVVNMREYMGWEYTVGGTQVENCSQVLGLILNREFHVNDYATTNCGDYRDPLTRVYFLNSSLQFVQGWVANGQVWVPVSILEFPLSQVQLGGVWYNVYAIQNRSANVYHPNGKLVTSLPVGSEVATNVDTTGASKKTLLIKYFRPPGGSWTNQFNDGSGNISNYGFVDTGITYGSGPSKISIKTSLA